MRLKSVDGTMIVDFYPVKGFDNQIVPNKFLQVLAWQGVEVQSKKVVSKKDMEYTVNERVYGYNYEVIDFNTLPQFANPMAGAV